MKLHVISSSSEGNAYALEGKSEALLIEAGAPFDKVLDAIGYRVGKVKGCIVTHEHGDHAARVKELLGYALEVYASRGTVEKINERLKGLRAPGGRTLNVLKADYSGGIPDYETFKLGSFEVTPFATQHDSAEPVGYYIWHPETGGILFATDTYYLRPTFDELNHVLIECNHDGEILARNAAEGRNGMTPELAARIRASHLSLRTCLQTLQVNNLAQVRDIVLIHVSHGNGDPQGFKKTIEAATGIPTHIAKPGLTINFNKPF